MAVTDAADDLPAAEKGRAVKIWGLKMEHSGVIRQPFKDKQDLNAAFVGLSEIEANLVKHRMFASGEAGVPALKGTVMGVLYSVNFMPGNQEIPVTIKWLNPQKKVVGVESVSAGYCRRQVASYSFTDDSEPPQGSWIVEFYYQNRKIGSQEIAVVSAERFDDRRKRLESARE
ncbi:MAG: hypothetical protein KJ717_05250 [Proteobacteria bacterium]|nr:hypothetical protein [Pseudomonadota bacterium]